MPIKLPKEESYFFEITRVTARLLYCIPKNRLHQMVEDQHLNQKIIEHYPDGIDMKVSRLHFDEMKKRYGLTIDIDPTLIWTAYWLIREKITVPYYGTGFIKRQFLEDLANRIRTYTTGEEREVLEPDQPEGLSAYEEKLRQTEIREAREALRKKLLKLRIKEINPEKALNEQPFSQVKMTKGDDPLAFLSSYKQKQRKGQ